MLSGNTPPPRDESRIAALRDSPFWDVFTLVASCTLPPALCALASRPRPYSTFRLVREQGLARAAGQSISNFALFKIRFRGRACGSCGRASPPQRPWARLVSLISLYRCSSRTVTQRVNHALSLSGETRGARSIELPGGVGGGLRSKSKPKSKPKPKLRGHLQYLARTGRIPSF